MPKMPFTSRQEFKEYGIPIDSLTVEQLDTISKLLPIKPGLETKQFCILIKHEVLDLYNAFLRYREIIAKNKKMNALDSMIYVYGNIIAERIYADQSEAMSSGHYNTTNLDERFVNYNSKFADAGIVYANMSKLQQTRLHSVLTEYTPKQLSDWHKAIAWFIKLDLTNYIGRLKRLMRYKNYGDLYWHIIRYGTKTGVTIYTEVTAKRATGLKSTILYWTNKGYDTESAKSEVIKFNTIASSFASQVTRGTSEYTVRSVSYWLKKGLNLEEASAKVANIQNSWKNYTPDQYDARVKNWLDVLNKKSDDDKELINLKKSHSPDGFMARTGVDYATAELLSIAFYKKRNFFSKISQDLFWRMTDIIGSEHLYFAELNYEHPMSGKQVDFFDKESGTVIEFHGDYWHANPETYSKDTKIYGMTAADIWTRDKERATLFAANPKVTNFVIIWESEFRKNPVNVVKYLCDIITTNRKIKYDTI